jgi:hypothetical protein
MTIGALLMRDGPRPRPLQHGSTGRLSVSARSVERAIAIDKTAVPGVKHWFWYNARHGYEPAHIATNVLILGAGASKHYDFPLAAEIVQRVRENVDALIPPHMANLGIDINIYQRVVARLLASGCTSIDQFAEYLDDPSEIFIAKALVAYHLATFEMRSSFSTGMRPTGHWYELLANRLIGLRLDDFPLRDIAVITFNYERSLEYYLFGCLTSRFGQRHTESEIRSAFLRLPIIHIYGRMGHLPGFGKTGEPERSYARIQSRDQLLAATAGMHMLRELRGDPSRGDSKAAQECLSSSSGNVIFLGFAFARENLEALDLVKTCAGKTVCGTIKDIEEDERHAELTERLKAFGIELNSNWRFDVYTALLRYPRTVVGPLRGLVA